MSRTPHAPPGPGARTRQDGLTVVELLVAGTLLTIVLSIATNFLIGQSRASDLQKATNEATDAARTALSLLTWDVQNAGYRVMVTNQPAEMLGIRAVDDGVTDGMIVRYLDESLAVPRAQRIAYDIGGTPPSLRRVQYDDVSGTTPSEQPTVATVVAMNVEYETRPYQYEDPDEHGLCSGDAEPIGSPTVNCLMPWDTKSTADRLVREVRIELLARSATRINGYEDRTSVYTFSDGGTFTPEPGYVYHFAEQTVLASNLGR